jgi:tRNA modification GTPase
MQDWARAVPPKALADETVYIDDTIVATATPQGRGAIAIVRLSGPRAIEIARALWQPLARSAPHQSRRLELGEIRDPWNGSVLDRAMCVTMPGPRTLTGENIAELHCHGGTYLVRRIVGLAMAEGARLAEPGEFSRRAFLNARIDLTQAEAIADLIDARSESALRNGIAHLTGALAARIEHLREQVITIRAQLEASIDFADEDIEPASTDALVSSTDNLMEDLTVLHQSFARGRIVREGARAAVIGKPNVGKSSILNLLLGAERAIVTAVAGTTRDIIEESVNIGAYPLVLHDTAGIRESADQVERIGISRAMASASEADIVIAVFDCSRALDAEDQAIIELVQARRAIAVLNKADLPRASSAKDLRSRGLSTAILNLSAFTADGLTELRDKLAGELGQLAGDEGQNEIVISRERHRDALAHAIEALKAARYALTNRMPPEIVAVDVALTAEWLGSITGEVSTEDVLDTIFREFCVGK